MAAIGDVITNGTAGSVLFIDSNVKLAQDNNGFYFDPATNTLKTKDGSLDNFKVATGDLNTGSGASNSGTVTVQSGTGQQNSSGTGSAGNSGTVTVNTGSGGSGSNGSLSGASGNLLLKTGSGGGNAQSGFSGGNAGHIILQPGNGGTGPAGQAAGGSTLIRASSSGDILAVQNSAGSTTHLGVANNGNVRVGASSATARLHLGAGTSSLAPLKFTAGTNLSSPEAGAMEWDGSKLYMSPSTSLRRALEYSSEVANVLDFGAKGDGSTDDAAAFQAAADSLATTGGEIYVPPGKVYLIGSKVSIKSSYPVWMVSKMGNRLLAISALGSSGSASALIRPKNPLTFMFEWARPTGATGFYQVGGGGIEGITFADWIDASTRRNQAIDGAINIDEAPYFTIRDSYFAWLKGRAIRVGRCVVGRVENTWIIESGDTGKSPIDIDGSSTNTSIDKLITGVGQAPSPSTKIHVTVPSHGYSTGNVVYIAFVQGTTEANGVWTITVIDPDTIELTSSYPSGDPSDFQHLYTSGGKVGLDGIFGFLWGDSMGIETSSHGAAWIKGTSNGHAWLKHCYFEDGGNNDQSFVDQSAGGGLVADGCSFNGTGVTQVIVGGAGSVIRNSTFSAGLSGDTPHIQVSSTAAQSTLQNIVINGLSGQTGRSLSIEANFCQISNVYMNTTGRLDLSNALECTVSNIYMYNPAAGDGTYAIELASNSLNGALIRGTGTNTCHGISTIAGSVSTVTVHSLNNRNGITATGVLATLTGNRCYNLGTGAAYVYTYGNIARNNFGVTLTNTVTSGTGVTGTITQHAEAASFLTDQITTAPNSTYTITLTNQLISASSVIHVKATLQDSNAGVPVIEKETRSNGSVVWVIRNIGSGAFNGTNPLRIDYIVQNF
jgi:hypothetical protein